ncbi:unnamed protein product [Dibothriocephalus latus]|uniref:Uncharacterized protein n=1 Tax=Dibothriocephalus latus TaxID=60516 RepID=A0A3P6T9S1_DIBLA|nr:unnamed protein product [Dibothriocephalus latus]
MLTYLTINQGLGAYIATYCILFGIGMGIPYSVIFQVASSCPLLSLLLLWGLLLVTYAYVAVGAAGPYLYAIWTFAIFFCLSGHFVIIPGACTRSFGPKIWPQSTVWYMPQHESEDTVAELQYPERMSIRAVPLTSACATKTSKQKSAVPHFDSTATPSALLAAAIISQFDVKGAWIAVYTACAVCCFISFFISLFLRDEQVRCVDFTSTCSRHCDRCSHQPISDELEDKAAAAAGDYGDLQWF